MEVASFPAQARNMSSSDSEGTLSSLSFGDVDSDADDASLPDLTDGFSDGSLESESDHDSESNDENSDTDSVVGEQHGSSSGLSDSESQHGSSSGLSESESSLKEATSEPSTEIESESDVEGDSEECDSDGSGSESDMSLWDDHVRQHGPSHDCDRCVYMRNKHRWRRQFTFVDNGSVHSWIEQKDSGVGAWALGCKVCRLAGVKSVWGQTCAQGVNMAKLQRHEKHHSHKRSLQQLLHGEVSPSVEALTCAEDRHDVPCFAMCFAAYKGALEGKSFTDYTKNLEFADMAGARLPQSRRNRMTAAQLVECFAEELQAEDKKLLRECSHIHLTMDGRKNNLVVRIRMALKQLPKGMCRDDAALQDGARPVRNITGKNFVRADRLLVFRRIKGNHTTADLAVLLADALRQACGTDEDLWESVRRKVVAFTPDGAHDEQLAGRLCGGGESPAFPNLRAVLRCSAHAFQGAMKAGWTADELANDITTNVVQEVAKYIRSSDRFAARLSAKAVEEAVEALENFSYAPQRFSSRDRPLSRFIVFAQPVLEVLALEVVDPTSSKRKAWAQRILRKLDHVAWCMAAMLADLADDCARVTRELDRQRSDPVEFQQTLAEFRAHLKEEYIKGRMWLRSGTYADRMMTFLRGSTRVVQFGEEYQVLRAPTMEESRRCQAHVALVAEGILKYLKAEFPEFCIQAHFVCFRLDHPEAGHLHKLLAAMGFDETRAAACLAQYGEIFHRAKRLRQHEDSDLECWARAAKEWQHPCEELEDILGILISFLVSETECERTFSHERRQFDNRPKLGPKMRFAGLKVMVDGVRLDRLQQSGEPTCNFWSSVQEQYASRFGSRFLMHIKQRKDRNTKRVADGRRKAGAKQNFASVQRERAQAVNPVIPFTAPAKDVFGFEPVEIPELLQLRQDVQTAVYTKIISRAQKKYELKRSQYKQVRQDRSKPISFMSQKEFRQVKQKTWKKKRAFAVSNIFGRHKLCWPRLLKSLETEGQPWFYLQPELQAAWQRSDPAMLELHLGGRPFKEMVASNLDDYVLRSNALGRRIILVSSVDAIPWHIKMAAAIVRARVQERIFVPLLTFSLRHPLFIAFSEAFAQKHKQLVGVLRRATKRKVEDTVRFPQIQLLRGRAFWTFVGKCSKKGDLQQCHYLYEDRHELEAFSKEQLDRAKTFDEFFGKVAAAKAAMHDQRLA